MSTSDVLATLAIVVSVVTFVVTIYEQYLKRPKLAIELGNAYLSYGEGLADLWAVLPVSLINHGASEGVVTTIAGTLASVDRTWTAPIAWSAFETPTDVGQPGKTATPWWTFTGWVSPMIAPSRKASTTWIGFSISAKPWGACLGRRTVWWSILTRVGANSASRGPHRRRSQRRQRSTERRKSNGVLCASGEKLAATRAVGLADAWRGDRA